MADTKANKYLLNGYFVDWARHIFRSHTKYIQRYSENDLTANLQEDNVIHFLSTLFTDTVRDMRITMCKSFQFIMFIADATNYFPNSCRMP